MGGPALRLTTKHTGMGPRLGVKLHLPKASVADALGVGWGRSMAFNTIAPTPHRAVQVCDPCVRLVGDLE